MRGRRKRRRPSSKGKRNLFLFALVVLGLAGLIAYVSLSDRTPKRVMPPESPEMTAKRESPDNAFYAVWEAAKSIPPMPHSLLLPVKVAPNSSETYFAEPNSIGSILDLNRPDDDPALALYVLSCQPALKKLHKALEGEYFLYPRVGTPHQDWTWDGLEYWKGLSQLNGIIIASMLLTAANPDQQGQVADFFSDALRLCEWIGEDGGPYQYLIATSMIGRAANAGARAATRIDSPDALRKMLSASQAVRLHERPLAPYLEFRWRAVDNLATEIASGEYYGGFMPERLIGSWMLSRHCRFLREHKEELLALADLSWTEYHKLNEQDLQHLFGGWRFPYGDLNEVQQLNSGRMNIRNSIQAATVLINLEQYQREHGTYPDTLEQLVPDYLDAIPIRTESNLPLVYERDSDDFWLYPGPKRNDLKDIPAKERRRLVMHCPRTLTDDE